MLAWARELASEGDTGMGYPKEYGGKGSPGRSVTSFETLAMGDLSLLVKCGVQFGLFGGAILHLGTERHHEALPAGRRAARPPRLLRDDRDRPRLQRAGAARRPRPTTETASSSSTRPSDDARKDYIGNAARDGRMAVVFAQLIVGGEKRGVHAILVPIRDDDGEPLRRRPDRGLRRQARPQRRRQRPALVRPRARPAREPARPLRAGRTRTAPTSARSRTRRKRFFTMIGTLIQGRISVSRRVDHAPPRWR